MSEVTKKVRSVLGEGSVEAQGSATQWLKDFGVATIPEIANTDAFKKMLDFPDFNDATGFNIRGGLLIVYSDTQMWGWERVGGDCVLNSTIFPVQTGI